MIVRHQMSGSFNQRLSLGRWIPEPHRTKSPVPPVWDIGKRLQGMPCISPGMLWTFMAPGRQVDYSEMAQAGIAKPGSARCKVCHQDFPEGQILLVLSFWPSMSQQTSIWVYIQEVRTARSEVEWNESRPKSPPSPDEHGCGSNPLGFSAVALEPYRPYQP